MECDFVMLGRYHKDFPTEIQLHWISEISGLLLTPFAHASYILLHER